MRVSLTLKGFYTHWEKAKQKPQCQGEPPHLPQGPRAALPGLRAPQNTAWTKTR